MRLAGSVRVVLDTNVLIAAFRSPSGASARILDSAIDRDPIVVCNPALFLEWEAVLKREEHLAAARLTLDEADASIRALARIVEPVLQGRLLRPLLADPDDEMVLEAAIFGAADAIVTFELATFRAPARAFHIDVVTPAELLARMKI